MAEKIYHDDFNSVFKNELAPQLIQAGKCITDLEEENERLRSRIKFLEAENVNFEADWHKSYAEEFVTRHEKHRLVDRIEELEKDNEQLRCLVLHAMIYVGKYKVHTCHYEYKRAIMYEKWCDFTDKVVEAYHKAKAALRKEMDNGKSH